MRSLTQRVNLAGLASLVLVVVTGCSQSGSSVSPVAASIQKKLFVTTKPELVESLKATYDAPATEQELSVAGRIYAPDGMSAFDGKESVFTIVELPKPGHLDEDPGDCPFCRRDLKNAKMAIIQVVDQSNNTYPQSADKLLGLKKNQDVLVTGKSNRMGDTIFIQASSLYVLSLDEANELSKKFHPSLAAESNN